MAKRKLQRFAELDLLPTIVHPLPFDGEVSHPLSSKWKSDFFKNEQDLVLELGCGRGEYTINLARMFPMKNFVGIDIKGARIWRGAKTAFEEPVKNAGFLRIQLERIEHYFGKHEVDEIWITFPDPHVKQIRENKRLTSSVFLERYRHILKEGGIVHLKTDNRSFYEYTLEVLETLKIKPEFQTDDVYGMDDIDEVLKIKTTYEEMFSKKGFNICYVRFVLD